MYCIYILYYWTGGCGIQNYIEATPQFTPQSHSSLNDLRLAVYSLCRLGDQKNAELSAGHFAIVALKL